ncbi:multicopper oxidase domain-containing protein [Streptomyces sp. NPDC001941]|uniref:multicopper oxidase family protein n=1 Tax=Streptomyces sp. NPDC001941 TaxID=3154659 RepID=UPI00333100DE
MVTRRSLLGAAVGTTGAGLFTAAALTPLFTASGAQAGTGDRSALDIERFAVPLPPLQVLAPTSTSGGTDTYTMTMRRVRKEVIPGFQTDVLTYNGSFPGPTIRARSGRPVVIKHRNALENPTSVHLHGASVPPNQDGAPMDTFGPGESRTYTYANKQPHASLWYHDHAHHNEAEHVYRGLSGSYLLSDDHELALPLPAGQYEIPIALRDAHFDEAGQLVYVMDDALGRTTLLANGRPYPYLEVAARKYRFRFLNSSNMRFFRLRLADGGELVQIGSDGGLLPRPFRTDAVWLSPAERADVVIDFSRYPVGTKIVLENTLGPGTPDQVGQVLRFDVVRKAADLSTVPSVLRSLPSLPKASVTRSMELKMNDETGAPGAQGLINGKVYDHDRIDTSVRYGASEIWTVTNPNTIVPHNFHMHLVQFRVLERNGKQPDGSEAGLKDTVRLLPGETVKVQATFDTYKGVYVYHCHLLDHSAMGMMAQFKVG